MEKTLIVENVIQRLSLTSEDSQIIEDLVDDTINLFLMKRYPFDRTKEYKDLSNRDIGWVVRATVEVYLNLGYANIKSYSESGLSMSFEKMDGNLSSSLANEIVPMVGVVT